MRLFPRRRDEARLHFLALRWSPPTLHPRGLALGHLGSLLLHAEGAAALPVLGWCECRPVPCRCRNSKVSKHLI